MFAKMDILEVKSLNFFVLLRSFDAELIKIVWTSVQSVLCRRGSTTMNLFIVCLVSCSKSCYTLVSHPFLLRICTVFLILQVIKLFI